jgi:ABC-type dipeptide/oligopeptide/nickel transport system ATPase component
MIRIDHLSVSYRIDGGQVDAVRDLSLDIPRNRVTAVVGESGSGKSTLLYSILRLLPPGSQVSGQIRAGERNVLAMHQRELNNFRWKECALILQGAMSSFTPVLPIGRQIAETLSHHLGLLRREALSETVDLLERVGLPGDFAGRYPHELSGGQKQRAAIAMAVSCKPAFLLADEPTTALDVITQAEITVLLADLVTEEGMGLCMVTHDLALAVSVCHNLAVMKEGRIVESGRPEAILENPAHPHTAELVHAIRELEGGGIRP